MAKPTRSPRLTLGTVAEFEKATLVAKLAAARRRKRVATGKKVEGRKSHVEKRPEVVALAKPLARKKPKGGKLSLRAVSAELAAQGYLNERGTLLASCVARVATCDRNSQNMSRRSARSISV